MNLTDFNVKIEIAMNGSDTLFIILMAVSLSACAGIRAFLPPLAVSLLALGGYIQLAPGFSWMADPLVAGAFALAAVIELVADKFPGVDHALDTAGLVLRPLAGGLLTTSLITGMDPALSLCLGVIVGGSMAGIMQAAKGSVRVLSSATTGGLANPLVSWVEDVVAFIGTILSIVVPILAAALAVTLAVFIVRKGITMRQRVSMPRA